MKIQDFSNIRHFYEHAVTRQQQYIQAQLVFIYLKVWNTNRKLSAADTIALEFLARDAHSASAMLLS